MRTMIDPPLLLHGKLGLLAPAARTPWLRFAAIASRAVLPLVAIASSGPNVVSIEDGFVVAIQAGDVVIAATFDGFHPQVAIAVDAPPLAAPLPVWDSAGASTQPVTVAVLENDDSNGTGALAIGGVSQPQHGSAVVSGTDIIYTPGDAFNGSDGDEFYYTVSGDTGVSRAARVSITNSSRGLDSSFGRDGRMIDALGLGHDYVGSGVVIQDDGKIVVVGHSNGLSGTGLMVKRFESDGGCRHHVQWLR